MDSSENRCTATPYIPVRPASHRTNTGMSCILALCISACASEPIIPPEPVICSEQTCPDGWCKLTINFVDDCKDLFETAEVLIGESLEPKSALVGTPFLSEGDIPVGTSEPVWIRANGWQWKLELSCAVPETDGEFTLSCNTSSSP